MINVPSGWILSEDLPREIGLEEVGITYSGQFIDDGGFGWPVKEPNDPYIMATKLYSLEAGTVFKYFERVWFVSSTGDTKIFTSSSGADFSMDRRLEISVSNLTITLEELFDSQELEILGKFKE